MRSRQVTTVLLLVTATLVPAQTARKVQAGDFLVAARELLDPNFARTVILLIDHDPRGSRGLVINRPGTAALDEVFPEVAVFADLEETLFFGGPVEPRRVLSLVRTTETVSESREIIEGVRLCWSLESLGEVIGAWTKPAPAPFRVYAGYAGWAPGQLAAEIEAAAWRVLPAERTVIFGDPEAAWERLIEREGTIIVQTGSVIPADADPCLASLRAIGLD